MHYHDEYADADKRAAFNRVYAGDLRMAGTLESFELGAY